MAQRVLPFTATFPANTPSTSPVTVPWTMDNWNIERIDLEVPPGPSGLMGFQILNNGVAWIPYGAGNWLIWDDVRESYYMTDQPNASGWAALGYNTDVAYPHTVTVRFHVNAPTVAVPTAAPAITFVTTPAADTAPVTLG